MTARGAIAIAGFGSSQIVRRSQRSITSLAVDAILEALTDAGLTREDIDGYVGAPWATHAGAVHAEGADEISCKTIVRAFGLSGLTFWADLYRGYATDMAAMGAQALLAGSCRYVLGVRALFNLEGPSYATSSAPVAYGDDQFVKPYGYSTAGARFAARARRYMAETGATREDLYAVVALARRHAVLNPHAVWAGKFLSLDDYLAGAPIATPHGLYDCDMPVCGAAAFVMCRGEDLPDTASPAYVAGWSGFQNPEAVFTSSGLGVADVTCCQLYDGFSSMVYEWLDGFGFCTSGPAWKFIRDGHADRDGRLPLNTFGGSLGEGRLHGIGHLREAYLQVAGKAGARQLRTAETCLVQNGPYDGSSFVMLCSEPRFQGGRPG